MLGLDALTLMSALVDRTTAQRTATAPTLLAATSVPASLDIKMRAWDMCALRLMNALALHVTETQHVPTLLVVSVVSATMATLAVERLAEILRSVL
jgi:hypothetical protein